MTDQSEHPSAAASSLNRQVLLPLVSACLVAAVGLAALSQWLAARQASAQSRARLQSVADALADTAFPITPPVLEILRSLSGFEFVVADHQSRLRGSTPAIDAATAQMILDRLAAPLPDLAGAASSDSNPAVLDKALTDKTGSELIIHGKSYRVTTLHRPAVNDSLLVLLEPQAEREATAQQLALMPLLTGLTTLVLVGAVALATSRRLVRRIAYLQEQVHEIATGRSERVVMKGPRDELTSLAESVNRMADELRSVWRTIRETERSRLLSQVAGGLAHQLRNALTGIHLAVQLHRRDCPLANQESLVVAEAELARTAEYIQQLLHSAAGKVQPAHGGILSAVLDEAQSLLDTIAAHRRIGLKWQRDAGSESITIADRELLRSAVMNLVLNALDAAGPDGDVAVSTRTAGGRTLLRVSDSGSGPSSELSESLFDPFVSSKPEGLGMGLTVVRSAATALGGEVRWYREQGRTVFEFSLPQHAAP